MSQSKNSFRKIGITETALRDAHQSLMATRLRIEDMLPVLEKMDQVGYHSLEVWGGATFDSCMRFLNEDPWERLRVLRKHIKNTKLQMLLRGQNLVGYRHYGDDVVREFVKRAVGNGIDIMRVFDALNDLRNLEVASEQVKREGAHLQMCISYTISPVHTNELFIDIAGKMRDMGADSICIKDMAGLLSPVDADRLVRGIKKETELPVQVHSHYTSGLASMAYYAAIEAGADVVDCAISPFSMRTSQPASESMVAALSGGSFDTGLSLENMVPIADHFKKLRTKYDDLFVKLDGADTNVLIYQIPGGMYSNLVNQLREQSAEHRLDDVLKEVPVVRKAMGYPPLVTPTSQIVGTQATLNVLVGERWKIIPKEVKNYFMGYYGKPPAEVDPEVQAKALGGEKPITCRPGEKIDPELDRARADIAAWITQPEDVLSYVLFPAVAKDFLMKQYSKLNLRDIGLDEVVEEIAYPV
ncbi:pyruvate carboxylase subunit B [Dethiosulfovibrio sp. F2B]|uniref:pyruvate carboxylase subunit B n=1 Tax=Dethiosulfovibrio faecalis TaxID=2720018 RepID=UPI001F17AB57|nr:pyruvate carboxylase subunit B [Dethiosulfovibrio faecalis]MCF4152084.1 pyruvate carboxylase subunit B [Dethiosulfovibrio faecalis]